jgi:hypothetical protein
MTQSESELNPIYNNMTQSESESNISGAKRLDTDFATYQNNRPVSHADNFNHYINETLGISLYYPEDWKMSSDNSDVRNPKLLFYPAAGNGTYGFYISVERGEYSVVDLDSKLNDKIIEFRQVPGFELIQADSNSSLGGRYAYKLEYMSNGLHSSMEESEYGTAVDTTNLYYIHFFASAEIYKSLLPTFNKILNSFEIFPIEDKHSEQTGYIEIGNYSGMLWNKDNLNVYIVVDPNDKQSLNHINDAQRAIEDWSHLLKNYSGNSHAWNFNVFISSDPLEFGKDQQVKTKFNPAADIVVQLLADPDAIRCGINSTTQTSLGDGLSYGFPQDAYGPVYSYADTSCGPADSFYEYDSRHIYHIVAHEFAHDLGLMHAHNLTGDLMCGNCEWGLSISPTDVKALIYMYGPDGFAIPNPTIEQDVFYANGSNPVIKSNQNLNEKFVKYVNSTYGISTEYPKGWSVEGSNELPRIAIIHPLGNHGIDTNTEIDIYADTKVEGQNANAVDLEQMKESVINSYKSSFENFQLTNSSTKAKLGDHVAYMISGKYSEKDTGIKQVTEIGFTTDKAAITVEIFSQGFNHYSSDISHILNAFRYG